MEKMLMKTFYSKTKNTMKILIKVTKQVLEASKMCGVEDRMHFTTHCAIAFAVREVFPDAEVCSNYQAEIKCRHVIGTPLFKIPLCEKATDFIYTFDSCTPEERAKLNPIEFTIDVPHEVIESIGIGQVYKVLSESKTLEHVN
jgi:hypothetical protein